MHAVCVVLGGSGLRSPLPVTPKAVAVLLSATTSRPSAPVWNAFARARFWMEKLAFRFALAL